MSKNHPRHPLGNKAKVLLSSVFGPYAQDDEYGSRSLDPMELFHNQVTRADGPFSLRMFHRSYSLMMLQGNIDAPCTILDFPTMEQFVAELRMHSYDIVGITAIAPNILKVGKMCELIREHLPQATILVGGHVANVPDMERRVDADYIVKGDGIAWLRGFLGEDITRPIRHPLVKSAIKARALGIPVQAIPGVVSAKIFPSAGCPLGCNFCSTSAFFGGKGKHVDFYKSGDELFSIMCHVEKRLKTQSFFIQDENFLLYKPRALRLLELMEQHGKSWSLFTFSSANAINQYTMEQIIGLGISWVWLGIEGKDSQYGKLSGVDTKAFVRHLQGNGIHVLGSTIIGLENHTPENIDDVITWAVEHETDFHQFMLYNTPPGTPLYNQLKSDGLLLSEEECPLPDYHGQYRFSHRHKHIPPLEEIDYLIRAFIRDRDANGPGIARVARTQLTAYRLFKDHPNPRIRKRIRRESRILSTIHCGLISAVKSYFEERGNLVVAGKMSALLDELHAEFGWKSKLSTSLVRRILNFTIHSEERRIAEGRTYEPPLFRELNPQAVALENKGLMAKFKVRNAAKRWVSAK